MSLAKSLDSAAAAKTSVAPRAFLGAGVLPYSVTTENKVMILLGRERYHPHWPSSKKWCAFSGGAYERETTAQTAARECYEETMGIVGSKNTALFADLLERTYDMKIDSVMPAPTTQLEARHHTTYLARVPWIPDVSERFALLRRRIVDLVHHSKAIVREQSSFQRPFLHEGMLLPRKAGRCVRVVALCDVQIHGSGAQELVVDVIVQDDHEMCFSEQHRVALQESQQIDAMRYEAWFHRRNFLDDYLQGMDDATKSHKCITIIRNYNQKVTRVQVHAQFLEKSDVRYWCVDEIREAICKRGWTMRGPLRYMLLPVLDLSIRVLEQHYASPLRFTYRTTSSTTREEADSEEIV